MAARLPPELAGELYCRANLEPMIYNVMNPQIAIELLDRAWAMLTQNQISFSFNYIDKPKEGSGFFLKVQPDEIIMPHDGYQYMDDEVSYSFPMDSRLTITERSQGFVHGDQYTHIVRRKYTLVHPGRETLAFLHYARADISRSVVVDGRRAKTPARQYPLKPIPGSAVPPPQAQAQAYQSGFRPQQPPKVQNPYAPNPAAVAVPPSPQQQGPYGRFSAVAAPVVGQPGQQPPQRLASINQGAYGNQRHDKKSSHKKHHQQQPQLTPQQQAQMVAQQQAQAQEDAEEPSGDELDFLTARDVAIARYKRNHDYIAEVFSPYPTSRIIPPRPEYEKSIEFLKALGAKHEIDLDALTEEHDEKIKKFRAEAAVFYKGLEGLKQATTAQEVYAANERVETYKSMTVQPYSALRIIELPKNEATRTPEPKPARLPKQPVELDTSMIMDAKEPTQDTSAIIAAAAAQAGVVVPGVADQIAVNGTHAPTAAASEAMEVDPVATILVQESQQLAAGEDTEMASSNDFPHGIVDGGNQENMTPTVTPDAAPSAPVAAQEMQPAAISAPETQQQQQQQQPVVVDVVMEEHEHQHVIQDPSDATATATTEPAPAATAPIVETPSAAAVSSESMAPIPVTTITPDDQPQLPMFTVPIAAEQPMITEMFVQESFTSSIAEDDHVTKTTSNSYTTSLTDVTGTTVTDITQVGDTVVDYADGHQEQFPQESAHQHIVEHTGDQQQQQGNAQIEAAPMSTVTITELPSAEPNATDSADTNAEADATTLTQSAVDSSSGPAPAGDAATLTVAPILAPASAPAPASASVPVVVATSEAGSENTTETLEEHAPPGEGAP